MHNIKPAHYLAKTKLYFFGEILSTRFSEDSVNLNVGELL